MASWKDLYERLIRGCGYSQIIDDLRLKPSRLLAMLRSKRMAKALQARRALAVACQVQGFEEAADSIATRLISLSLTRLQPMAARNACLDVLELSGQLDELRRCSGQTKPPAGRIRRGTRAVWPSPLVASTRRRRTGATAPAVNRSDGADSVCADAASSDSACAHTACGLTRGLSSGSLRHALNPQAADQLRRIVPNRAEPFPVVPGPAHSGASASDPADSAPDRPAP